MQIATNLLNKIILMRESQEFIFSELWIKYLEGLGYIQQGNLKQFKDLYMQHLFPYSRCRKTQQQDIFHIRFRLQCAYCYLGHIYKKQDRYQQLMNTDYGQRILQKQVIDDEAKILLDQLKQDIVGNYLKQFYQQFVLLKKISKDQTKITRTAKFKYLAQEFFSYMNEENLQIFAFLLLKLTKYLKQQKNYYKHSLIETLLFIQTLLDVYIEDSSKVSIQIEKIITKIKNQIQNEFKNKAIPQLNLASIPQFNQERQIKTDRLEELDYKTSRPQTARNIPQDQNILSKLAKFKSKQFQLDLQINLCLETSSNKLQSPINNPYASTRPNSSNRHLRQSSQPLYSQTKNKSLGISQFTPLISQNQQIIEYLDQLKFPTEEKQQAKQRIPKHAQISQRYSTSKEIFWFQVQNKTVVKQIAEQKQNSIEKPNQVKAKQILYRKLTDLREKEKKNLEAQQKLEQERQAKIESEELQKQQQDLERKRLIDLRIRERRELTIKWQTNRRFNLYDVMIAAHFNYMHNELPYSKKFAKLVSKHFLSILNFRAVETSNKLEEIEQEDHVVEQKCKYEDQKKQNQQIQQQIKEIQLKLNDGLMGQRHRQKSDAQPTFNKIWVSKYEKSLAKDLFSQPVIRIIRVLQTALKLKIFSMVRKKEQQAKQSQIRQPKQSQNSYDFTKKNKFTKMGRLKARRGSQNFEFLNDLKTMNHVHVRDLSPFESSPGVPKKGIGVLGVFKAVQNAKTALKNQTHLDFLNKKTRLNSDVLQNIFKDSQQLYYPLIRYISIYNQDLIIWRIKYKDITTDNSCLIIYFSGEGAQQHFFRLDIPINSVQKEAKSSEQITIWPTVLNNLKGYINNRGQEKLLREQIELHKPQKYNINFIQGLNTRARQKIGQYDIESIVETKQILHFLQSFQICKIKKLLGETYELLPQFTMAINEVNLKFLINLPLINNLISEIRAFEYEITYLKRIRAFGDFKDSQQETIDKYMNFLHVNDDCINAILYFRFLSASSVFYQDQNIESLYRLKQKQIYLQCSMINIKEIIEDNLKELRYLDQLRQFCLLQLSINLNGHINYSIQNILFDINNDNPIYASQDSQSSPMRQEEFVRYAEQNDSLEWIFNQELFYFQIGVIFFEKDQMRKKSGSEVPQHKKQQKQIKIPHSHKREKAQNEMINRYFTPLKLTFKELQRLNNYLQQSGKIQKLNINEVLKQIILDKAIPTSQSFLIDYILKKALTIDFQEKKVILKQRYSHVLNNVQNFINKLSDIRPQNISDQLHVFRYAISPLEHKLNQNKRQYLPQYLNEEGNPYLLTFNRLFQEIASTDLRYSDLGSGSNQENIKLKDDFFSDALPQIKSKPDEKQIDGLQVAVSSQLINFEPKKPKLYFQIIQQRHSIFAIIEDQLLVSLERLKNSSFSSEEIPIKERFKITIVLRRPNQKYVLYTKSAENVYKIQRYIHVNPTVRSMQLKELVTKIYSQNDITNFQQQRGIGTFICQPCRQRRQKFHIVPNFNKLKFMLVSNSLELLNWMNKIQMVILNKYGSRWYSKITIYYSNAREQPLNQYGSQACYVWDGEHLFFNIELYSVNSKVQMYKIIFNKYDLKQLLQINQLDLDRRQVLDIQTLQNWCNTILQMIKFEKRFLYKIPFLQFYESKSYNITIDDQLSAQKYNLSEQPEFYSMSNISQQKLMNVEDKSISLCTTNGFSKINFDHSKIEKKYFDSFYKHFRIVGHYIQKLHIILNKETGSQTIQSEEIFKKNKHDKGMLQITSEFTIITISSHSVLDIWQIIYYFPRSKRKLMAYVNILDLQEMNYKDIEIMNILDIKFSFNSYKLMENYLKKDTKGQVLLRKHNTIDSNLLQRLKYQNMMSQEQQSTSQLNISPKRQPRSSLFTLSNNIVVKNKSLQEAIQQNISKNKQLDRFLNLTRQLNDSEKLDKEQKEKQRMKFTEMKIWSLLLVQVFQLGYTDQRRQNSSFQLQIQVIEALDSLYGRNQMQKVIGKQYQMKKDIIKNPESHHKVKQHQLQITEQRFRKRIFSYTLVFLIKPFDVKQNQVHCLKTENSQIIMTEYQCSVSLKLERFGAAYLECFIEQLFPIQIIRNSTTERTTTIKSIDNIFTPMDPIVYSQSSNYNLYLRYYSLSKKMAYKDVRINLRELLNLFIADGLFKSQTNYMNSKLNISDIQIMCQYIAYKIQSQNYLNLVQIVLGNNEKDIVQADEKNQIARISHLILVESVDTSNNHQNHRDYGDGQVYTMVLNRQYKTFHTVISGHITEENQQQNRIVLQLQAFPSFQKVLINQYDPHRDRFSQKEMYFNQIEETVPFFICLMNSGLIMEGLRRLGQTIREGI